MDRQLLEINQHCRAVKNQLLKERRKATPEEQQLLVEFATLIAERNEVRKSQLDALLVALAPMQDIRAPRTTTSGYSMVQGDVMQHNRRELIKLRQMFADNKIERSVLDANYARAERRLESLKKGNTDDRQIERLERMMHGYQNMLALEQIVKSTDDQLERLGAPRLMASIPTTAEERRQSLEKERDAHQEALDNGYY
ncbi:type III secretion protein [Xanthomonas dyei]|uniref:Type III secretion protein n=1 Tax=Xanthomonas dyei TaxID=743699 RepID=A0A2S7C594_9XANT|nr:type III secretion protein [Xanthomonas dyei]